MGGTVGLVHGTPGQTLAKMISSRRWQDPYAWPDLGLDAAFPAGERVRLQIGRVEVRT